MGVQEVDRVDPAGLGLVTALEALSDPVLLEVVRRWASTGPCPAATWSSA
jgi:hypothetical protein